MRPNQGFPSMGRPRPPDSIDRYIIDCGHCGEAVPTGAHIVFAPWGVGQMYCPGCCPCRLAPETLR